MYDVLRGNGDTLQQAIAHMINIANQRAKIGWEPIGGITIEQQTEKPFIVHQVMFKRSAK